MTRNNPHILWPTQDHVVLNKNADYTYIMREDGWYTMHAIALRLHADYGVRTPDAMTILLEEYKIFCATLFDVITQSFPDKKVEIHLFDAAHLKKRVRAKLGATATISLDPLIDDATYNLQISRGYYAGGITHFGQTPRPGSASLTEQMQKIKTNIGDAEVALIEDDIFTGNSIVATIAMLLNKKITVQKIVPAIQLGKLEPSYINTIKIDPVVTYSAANDVDIFTKVELCDPRDFLLGADGLVVKGGNGTLGRLPFVLPFVSPTARASISVPSEKLFSKKMLQANQRFFANVEKKLGYPILIRHLHPSFAAAIQAYGITLYGTAQEAAIYAQNNITTMWEGTMRQGELQQQLDALNLPTNLLFLDVNGTLFPDESIDGHIPPGDIDDLRHAIKDLKNQGIITGLCSDSPLPQLQSLASQLDVSGPILAENGNILYSNGKLVTINTLHESNTYKEAIKTLGVSAGLQQSHDCIAPEFGGKIPTQSRTWAFGAHRQASITVFAPGNFIKLLGEYFKDVEDVSVDCSPQHNFFALQPGSAPTKGRALSLLAENGSRITMVGNSFSDFVTHKHVQCTFVANARLRAAISAQAAYTSPLPYAKGVIGILKWAKSSQVNISRDT